MPSSRLLSLVQALALVFALACRAGAQETTISSQLGGSSDNNINNGDAAGQTLVISQNANGGIRVWDRATNRELVNTGSLQLTENEEDNSLVQGLLEWIEEKKRKKKEKKDKEKKDKERQPLVYPVPVPVPVQPNQPYRQERKEIHIHINNHIKKQPHKKHHGGKHHHYEHYHDGHGAHDKFYHGKHPYPLLGHHMFFDHFDHFDHHHDGGGGHHSHGHDHHDDEYSGYESRGVAQYAANSDRAKRRPAAANKKAAVNRETTEQAS